MYCDDMTCIAKDADSALEYFIAMEDAMQEALWGESTRMAKKDCYLACPSATEQDLKVAAERRNSAVIHSQSFPDGIAALDDAVKNGHPGVGTRHKFVAHEDDDVFVSRVGEVHVGSPVDDARIACSKSRSYHGWQSARSVSRRPGKSSLGS